MGLMYDLVSKLSDKHSPGGESYVLGRSLKLVFDKCIENNIPIIGIEGFEIRGEYIVPQSDLIGDFSCIVGNIKPETARETVKWAKQLMENRKDYKILLWTFEFYEDSDD